MFSLLSSKEQFDVKLILLHRGVTKNWLIRKIAEAFGVKTARSYSQTLENVQGYFASVDQTKVVPTVIIDDGHFMDDECLSTLYSLLNIEDNKIKFVQLIIAGQEPLLDNIGKMGELDSRMRAIEIAPMTPDELKKMLYEVAPEYKIKQFEETGDVDFAYEIPSLARYRANYFRQKYGVAAASLVFEIDEADVLGRLEPAVRFANAAKALGCGVLIDGFGRRAVSFNPLKVLRVDFVKVDGAIVRKLLASELARTKMNAILRVAEALGIGVIAENVEDDKTLAALKSLNVSHAQGFGLHVPQPIDTIGGSA
jgi:hypothetical protein